MANSDKSRGEEEADRRRGELVRADAECEEFVSKAAHHLIESLREIASYSQLISDTYITRLDSEAGKYLERIQHSAASMQSLLADMVDYCARTGVGPYSTPIEMEATLCHALLCADKQIGERSAVITHDPLPRIGGDFETLAKVLHHLIRNAIEYCVAPPQIHISSRQVAGDWVFSVRDNGPGIEPIFQARIFDTFKRLHGKELPGNGLGLAFSQ